MALRRSAGPYIWDTSLPQAPHRVNMLLSSDSVTLIEKRICPLG